MFKRSYDFIALRQYSFASAVMIVLYALYVLIGGVLHYGIDFKGGYVIEASMHKKPDIAHLRKALDGLGIGEISLQEMGGDNTVLIKLLKGDEDSQKNDRNIAAIKKVLGDGVNYKRMEIIGPKLGRAILVDGFYALVLSLIAMLVYVWVRFEWQFALCAILSLIHDCAAVICYYGLVKAEFNSTAIVAVLTTAGYSINDTVVIYDRIREYLRKFKKTNIKDLINNSINSTLSRTTLTSVTTLLALFVLYFIGGDVIAKYSMPMIIGIGCGTFSSIFVAGPLLLFFNIRKKSV